MSGELQWYVIILHLMFLWSVFKISKFWNNLKTLVIPGGGRRG